MYLVLQMAPDLGKNQLGLFCVDTVVGALDDKQISVVYFGGDEL